MEGILNNRLKQHAFHNSCHAFYHSSRFDTSRIWLAQAVSTEQCF